MTHSRILALLLSAIVLATALLVPGAARAADDDEATLEMARERFREGVGYFDRKQFAKARAAFLQAYALKPHPAVLLNLAQSELRSGYEADAAKHFIMFLGEHDAATPAEREAAEEGLASAKASVHELTVSADTQDADVRVDGENVGRTPLRDPIFLSPGKHTVELQKGDQRKSSNVIATAGDSTNLDLSLRPEPAAPAELPRAAEAAPSQADLGPEAEAAVDIGPSPGRKSFFSWLGSTPLAWVTTGITLAGVGTGIGFAVAANQHYGNADSASEQIVRQAGADMLATAGICRNPPTSEYRDACNAVQDETEKGDKLKRAATVGFVVGGLAAAGTVVFYFVSRSSRASARGAPSRHVALSPWLAPGSAGLVIDGDL